MIAIQDIQIHNEYEKLEKLRGRLGHLADRKLLGDLGRLNLKERKLKAAVLLYLAEIDRRELFLPLGYGSMFEFCVSRLGYTRATAFRRIEASRIVSRYPKALQMLLAGDASITTLSMLRGVINENNYNNLLEELRGKSVREVGMIVSRHGPVRVLRDSVRPVCVMRPVPAAADIAHTAPACTDDACTDSASTDDARSDGGAEIGTIPSCSNVETVRNDSGSGGGGGGDAPSDKDPERVVLEQRYMLRFSVAPEFMARLERVKSLLSGKLPEGMDLEAVFDLLMGEYLDRHDPVRTHARREKRRVKAAATGGMKKAHKGGLANRGKGLNPRAIPQAVRDRVFARDGGRCTFVGENGRRCSSTWDLEVDHIIPRARGGDDSPGNLRLLCRRHNLHAAERAYGKEFMRNHRRRE